MNKIRIPARFLIRQIGAKTIQFAFGIPGALLLVAGFVCLSISDGCQETAEGRSLKLQEWRYKNEGK